MPAHRNRASQKDLSSHKLRMRDDQVLTDLIRMQVAVIHQDFQNLRKKGNGILFPIPNTQAGPWMAALRSLKLGH